MFGFSKTKSKPKRSAAEVYTAYLLKQKEKDELRKIVEEKEKIAYENISVENSQALFDAKDAFTAVYYEVQNLYEEFQYLRNDFD